MTDGRAMQTSGPIAMHAAATGVRRDSHGDR